MRRKDVRRVECSARLGRIGDGPGPERVDPGAAGTPHVRAAKSRVAGKVVRGGAVGLGRQAGEHVARKPLGRAHRRAESEQFSHLADSAGSALRCGARCLSFGRTAQPRRRSEEHGGEARRIRLLRDSRSVRLARTFGAMENSAALVTGASKGIGKEIARQLAAAGFGLYTSRSGVLAWKGAVR